MRLARRMTVCRIGRGSAPAPGPVTAYYSSPGSGSDYAEASTSVAARVVFPGPTTTANCTVMCWARDCGSSFLGVGTVPSLSLYSEGNFACQIRSDEDTATSASATADPYASEWGHFAVTVSGSTLTAYGNGLVGAGTGTIAGNFSASDLVQAPPSAPANVCGIAIFSRALSGAEIAAVHAAGVTADIRSVVDATGLAVYWRDADTAGVVANVGSGGACGLVFNGAVTSETLP